jgi:hypothetical protein
VLWERGSDVILLREEASKAETMKAMRIKRERAGLDEFPRDGSISRGDCETQVCTCVFTELGVCEESES